MLFINKDGSSQKALNIIKRLAAFKNPDFYKAQAMRLPTFDKPRIISLSNETPEYLCLPRGCELDLINLFNAHSVNLKWIDKCYSGKQIDVEFNGQLREEQEDAVGSMIQHELTGGMSAKERKTSLEMISTVPTDSSIVLVATGRFVGEGFNLYNVKWGFERAGEKMRPMRPFFRPGMIAAEWRSGGNPLISTNKNK